MLASFPLCDLTEDDLTQNPRFYQLLAALSHKVDHTGLTASLKADLEKVGNATPMFKRAPILVPGVSV